MKISVDTRAPGEAQADLLAVPVAEEEVRRSRLATRLGPIDRALGGALKRVVAAGDFSGKSGQQALVYPDKARRAKRVLLLGVGKGEKLDADGLRALAGRAVSRAAGAKASRVALAVPPLGAGETPEGAQALAEGAVLAGYRFDSYRGKSPDDSDTGRVSAVALLVPRGLNLRACRAAARRGATLAESQNVARDLSNEPPNVLSPDELARRARALAREVGLRVKVLGVPELEKRGMNAILAVGGGSSRPPRLIVLEHRPGGGGRKAKDAPAPVCIVGKGVTFDSGGISIKPSQAMDEMKHDMSGAATVVGVMRACALLDLPIPVVGVIGAAENLPSSTAYRPGDVLRAASGKTIEVLNTDAEGRVVLADALHYATTEYEPCAIVDLATLTGACVVALGHLASGLFCENAALTEKLRSAGGRTAELVWPMPLLQGHKKAIESSIADIKNTGGRGAGASTAAAFLSHFVGDTPWAHLDIAGTAWTSNGSDAPYQPRGATGVCVRLLLEMLRDWDASDLAG